jgi:hypothetical protein
MSLTGIEAMYAQPSFPPVWITMTVVIVLCHLGVLGLVPDGTTKAVQLQMPSGSGFSILQPAIGSAQELMSSDPSLREVYARKYGMVPLTPEESTQ